jgi:hypothetical protein
VSVTPGDSYAYRLKFKPHPSTYACGVVAHTDNGKVFFLLRSFRRSSLLYKDVRPASRADQIETFTVYFRQT